jgi:glucose-1-phosphate thymidylyltransferase
MCNERSVRVLILAAGYGTRLQSIAQNCPKPLLPINGKPLINHIIDRISRLPGLEDIMVVTNDKFHDQFLSWAAECQSVVPIHVINDGSTAPENRLGSIGDIHYAMKEVSDGKDLLVVGGDNLFDFDLREYLRFAQEKSPAVSIGAYDLGSLDQASLFGVLQLDPDNKIISFEEKPQRPSSSLVSMCFYYFPAQSTNTLDAYLKERSSADRAGDFIGWLATEHTVFGFQFKGAWHDIGSVKAYHDAQKCFRE